MSLKYIIMTDHFYSYNPFVNKTYFYYRDDPQKDYKKLIYFPKYYEILKKNEWAREYRLNNLKILPWFLRNYGFVKQQSIHDYKVLRSKIIDLTTASLLGTISIYAMRFFIKYQFNPYHFDIFHRNVK